MSILSSVALGFFGRKLLDVGGWVGGVAMTAITAYNSMPPPLQAVVGKALTGHWQEITLAAIPGLVAWGWGQLKSYKATVKPQIVTSDGQKVDLDKLQPTMQATVEASAVAAPRRRTLADMLAEKLGKR